MLPTDEKYKALEEARPTPRANDSNNGASRGCRAKAALAVAAMITACFIFAWIGLPTNGLEKMCRALTWSNPKYLTDVAGQAPTEADNDVKMETFIQVTKGRVTFDAVDGYLSVRLTLDPPEDHEGSGMFEVTSGVLPAGFHTFSASVLLIFPDWDEVAEKPMSATFEISLSERSALLRGSSNIALFKARPREDITEMPLAANTSSFNWDYGRGKSKAEY